MAVWLGWWGLWGKKLRLVLRAIAHCISPQTDLDTAAGPGRIFERTHVPGAMLAYPPPGAVTLL